MNNKKENQYTYGTTTSLNNDNIKSINTKVDRPTVDNYYGRPQVDGTNYYGTNYKYYQTEKDSLCQDDNSWYKSDCRYLLPCGICEKTGRECPRLNRHQPDWKIDIGDFPPYDTKLYSNISKINSWDNYRLPDDYDNTISKINDWGCLPTEEDELVK